MGRKIFEPNDEDMNSREAITDAQIHTLLGVAGMLHSVLAGVATEGSSPAADGGARAAAEVTFNNVCSRLDAIINDPARWGTTDFDDFYRQSMQLLRAQTAATEEINTPHFRLKPTLFRLQNGGWAAIVGRHVDHALVGTGATPEEAIVAFDLIFKGQMSPQTVEWLTAREAQIEAGIPQTDNIEKYEEVPMDSSRRESTNKTARPRKVVSRDRKDPGAHGKIGRAEAGPDGQT